MVCVVVFISVLHNSYDPGGSSFKLILCDAAGLGRHLQKQTADLNQSTSKTNIDVDPDLGVVGNQLQFNKESFSLYKTPRDDIISTVDDFKAFVNHPVLVHHMQWTPTTPTTAIISSSLIRLWITALSTLPMANKLKNFRFFRGDMKVRVVIQGANYAYGQMVYHFTPLTVTTEGCLLLRPTTNLVNAKVVPHFPLNPNKIMTYEMTLPNPHVYDIFPLAEQVYSNTYGGSYEFAYTIYNALASGTAVSPNISICTYVYFENITMEALTTVDGLSNDPIKEEKVPRGLLSGPLHTVKTFADNFSGIPFIGEGVSLFSTAVGAASTFLSYIGFNKPTIQDTIAVIPNKVANNPLAIDGRSSEFVLASRNKNHYGLVEHPMQDLTHMDFSKICSTKGLIYQATIPQTAISSQRVFSVPVHPGKVIHTGNAAAGTLMHTPLSGILRMFHYFRGDMQLTFEIVASPFHRGSIVMAYDPRNTTPTLEVALATLKTVTVDISGDVGEEIHIPWQNVKALLDVETGTNQAFADAGDSNTPLGSVHVYVLNPIIANGSTDGVYVNVYNSSDNARFFMLNNMASQTVGYYQYRAIGTVTPLSAAYEEEDTLSTVEPLGFGIVQGQTVFVDTPRVSFGPRTTLDNASSEYFGEEIFSTKQIVTRQYVYAQAGLAGATSDAGFSTQNGIQPFIAPSATVVNSNLSYLAGAYAGYRGSFRWTMINAPTGAWTVQPFGICVGFHSLRSVFPADVFTANPANFNFYDHWGASLQNLTIMPSIDVITPPAVNGLYRPSCDVDTNCFDYVNFHIAKPAGATNTTSVRILQGGGDDFSLFFFLGFPTIQWP